MDVDIARLEAALSPYLVLITDAGIDYVSAALAKRLGRTGDEVKRNLEKVEGLTGPLPASPSSVSLASNGDGPLAFDCTTVVLPECTVVALAEEGQHQIIEYADRDTFVRMFNVSPVGYLVVDRGLVVYANEHLGSLLQMKREQVLGRRVISLVSSQSRADFVAACQEWFACEGSRQEGREIMLTASNGTRLRFAARGGWIQRASRQLLWVALEDVTRQDRLQRSLDEERQRFSDLFGSLPAGILYVDPRGRITDCNDYVAAIVGYSRERIRGSVFTDFVSDDQADILREDFRRLFTGGEEIAKRESMITTADGRQITIEYNARVISRKGHPARAIMMFTDVTDKKALEYELLEKNAEMERTLWDMAEVKDALEARAGELNKATEDLKLLNEKLNMLSITDGLTEVYNHRHFQDRLTEEVDRLGRLTDGVLSLLIMDIDDFKRFNDTYGHQCGDMVLKHIAGLLKGSIRSIDILARYGGEEFAVILPNASTEQAVVVAERICQTIRSTPFTYGQAVGAKVTMSIGVGTITSGQTDKSELVRKADNAMYAAKAKWKDRVEVWEED